MVEAYGFKDYAPALMAFVQGLRPRCDRKA